MTKNGEAQKDGGSVIIMNVQILLGFAITKLIVLMGVTKKIAVSRTY